MPPSKTKGDSKQNFVSFSGATARPAKEKRAKAPVRRTTRSSQKTVEAPAPTHEEIAVRAYFISQKREQAGIPGSPVDDWLKAEQELLEERKRR